MEVFTEIMKYIQTFGKYGCKDYENGTKLYGHVPFIAPKAYNFRVFFSIERTRNHQVRTRYAPGNTYCIPLVPNEKC